MADEESTYFAGRPLYFGTPSSSSPAAADTLGALGQSAKAARQNSQLGMVDNLLSPRRQRQRQPNTPFATPEPGQAPDVNISPANPTAAPDASSPSDTTASAPDAADSSPPTRRPQQGTANMMIRSPQGTSVSEVPQSSAPLGMYPPVGPAGAAASQTVDLTKPPKGDVIFSAPIPAYLKPPAQPGVGMPPSTAPVSGVMPGAAPQAAPAQTGYMSYAPTPTPAAPAANDSDLVGYLQGFQRLAGGGGMRADPYRNGAPDLAPLRRMLGMP